MIGESHALKALKGFGESRRLTERSDFIAVGLELLDGCFQIRNQVGPTATTKLGPDPVFRFALEARFQQGIAAALAELSVKGLTLAYQVLMAALRAPAGHRLLALWLKGSFSLGG
jgi:hypothetical protein